MLAISTSSDFPDPATGALNACIGAVGIERRIAVVRMPERATARSASPTKENVSINARRYARALALESRRRVKEQQKRIGSAEFRNTQFSYSIGPDGVEHFVATPELQSEDAIGGDPLPAGPGLDD